MQAVAKLKNLPISPRKVRLVADLIRGASATQGLAILKHTPKKCAIHLEKLLLSAVSNWEHKNENVVLEEAGLCIKEVWVDGAGMLKRLRPAPQGRAHRIRKRSSHITLIVDGTNRGVQPGGMAKVVPVKPTNQTEHNTDGAKS
ncbi:MAG TPA: 50S ribosomal protein L22 [Amoebophilaceae bacterium]|nr:50S ribosomal protein L22 [Amoebophilaceae bacterium]